MFAVLFLMVQLHKVRNKEYLKYFSYKSFICVCSTSVECSVWKCIPGTSPGDTLAITILSPSDWPLQSRDMGAGGTEKRGSNLV